MNLSGSASIPFTQETHFVLIQNILSHPKQLPSLKELLQAVEQQTKPIRRESDVTAAARLDVDGRELADTVTKAQNRFIAS